LLLQEAKLTQAQADIEKLRKDTAPGYLLQASKLCLAAIVLASFLYR
jgi:hypothetical protein